MRIDFSDVPEGSGDTVVPAGKYKMQVKGFEPCVAKTGKKQIRGDFEFLDNPEFEGLEKREYFNIDENSLWKLKRFMGALIDTKSLKSKEMEIDSIVFQDLLEDCVGKALFINYGVEEYEGLERNISRRFTKIKDVTSQEKED